MTRGIHTRKKEEQWTHTQTWKLEALRAKHRSLGTTCPKAVLDSPSERISLFLRYPGIKFWVKPSGLEEQSRYNFDDGGRGGHLGFPIWIILAIFDSHHDLSTKFPINWTFGSGEDQNRFLRWQPWQPSWILTDTISAIFVYKSLWYILPSFESIGHSVQEQKFKIEFQDDSDGGQLGFSYFDLLFRVDWPFG